MAPYNLLLPMKLDAFVFNSEVCNGKAEQAKIAPITQPNYTFLQFKDHLAQNDILDHVDLHNSSDSSRNPRFTDIGKGRTRQNRLGVYVHWSLPRPLRSGIASANKIDNKGGSIADPVAPRYNAIPNRWLVIRSLNPDAETTVPKRPWGLKPVMAWIIESDRTRNIDELPNSIDLEVDVAPFVTSFVEKGKSAGDIVVEEQAEVFIGSCAEAAGWDPDEDTRNPETRVGLTAASSSNQLFIDYQYHCGNVFSMVDTFAYPAKDGSTQHLESAVASYHVIGWHSSPAKDIMTPSADLKESPRAALLDALRIGITRSVPSEDTKVIDEWLDKPGEPARTLCHGTMYDVSWNVKKSPDRVPADEVASRIMKMPFAIGTSPIDAVMAYISQHSPNGDLESGLMALRNLLRADEDGVDAQMAAEDEIQINNYTHSNGGSHFFLPAKEGDQPGADPDVEKQDDLRLKNDAQHLLDAVERRVQQLRWEVFAWWWCYISDIDNKVTALRDNRRIGDIEKEINRLLKLASELQSTIIGTIEAPIKTGVMEGLHQRSDPTLVIGGVESGWPTDFNDNLRGRLENQILKSKVSIPEDAQVRCVHPDVRETAGRLVQEFLALQNPEVRPDGRLPPLYHDGKHPREPVDQTKNPWRDRWADCQPWFPLYVEWEAEYAHVDFCHWAMQPRPPRAAELGSKTTYVLKHDIRMREPQEGWKDLRYVSGRSLVLPQPSFSLKVHIDRLFATIPPNQLSSILTPEQLVAIRTKLDQLALLSMPLAGLTDHLITRYQGSHVKPLVRQPGQPPVVLKEAREEIERFNVDLSLIDQETDPTPYGSLQILVGQTISGFKPVTHGQMRFTSINIVDKFGQVVHAVDPISERKRAVLPALSEAYDVDEVPGEPGNPNVVDPRYSSLKFPEYIQLPPSINQPSRINAHFVVHGNTSKGEHKWRPATEFDKPIWGWVVINYVDNGLQFFLPDGKFYREVRTTESHVEWLPFMKPPRFDSTSTKQLDALIKRLVGDKEYLSAFKDMIKVKLSSTVPAPNSYSQFLNSLVGRPLALANMGWSLELGTKSRRNESTLEEQQEAEKRRDLGLLPGDGKTQYEFPLKFGDKDHNYDGLVGYFKKANDNAPKEPGNDLNLDSLYTYFNTDNPKPGNPIKAIDTKSYPALKAFWLDPSKYVPDDEDPERRPERLAELCRLFEKDRNANLQVFGVLFDPFAPVVGFSSILPARSLRLPAWTWETALKKITTFFHAGPLLLTDGVPDFRGENMLKDETGPCDPDKTTFPGAVVALPALKAAEWAWLQPYDLCSDDDPQAYMSLNVSGDSVGEKPAWKKGPLTAVTGFMQLKEPIEQKKK